LRTEGAKDADIRGSFALILYGSRHLNDIETIAILDMEGDRYGFEPYAPEFDYKIKRGIPAKEALEEAERFVSWHSSFYRTQLSRTSFDEVWKEIHELSERIDDLSRETQKLKERVERLEISNLQ
jgi:hypothetical protein